MDLIRLAIALEYTLLSFVLELDDGPTFELVHLVHQVLLLANICSLLEIMNLVQKFKMRNILNRRHPIDLFANILNLIKIMPLLDYHRAIPLDLMVRFLFHRWLVRTQIDHVQLDVILDEFYGRILPLISRLILQVFVWIRKL